MGRMRVALLFGGPPGEYDVSCASAAALADCMDPALYEVLKIGVTRRGRWLHYPGGTDKMRDDTWHTFPDCTPAFLSPDRTTRGLVTCHGSTFDTVKLDLVLPAMHGHSGEDGGIRGLLELAGIPYVGCGPAASALCLNKAAANLVFEAHNLPHAPWLVADRAETDDSDAILFRMGGRLRFPVMVRPAASGSSAGVSRVDEPEGLRAAMLLASAHGRKIIIEQAVNAIEAGCAVMGNASPFSTLPGEVEYAGGTYGGAAKHTRGTPTLHIPARLGQEKQLEVREMALKAYRAMGCAGFARVDFFIERESRRVLINRVNTLPGFTPAGLYPRLMEYSGISMPELVDRLILYATERAEG